MSPDDVRALASRSRESLREHSKQKLSELRRSATERRSKSPAVDTSQLLTELDDMQLDEDADMPFPPDLSKGTSSTRDVMMTCPSRDVCIFAEEREMQDVGTSPIIFSKDGTRMSYKTE